MRTKKNERAKVTLLPPSGIVLINLFKLAIKQKWSFS
jgi:hypothetical protein